MFFFSSGFQTRHIVGKPCLELNELFGFENSTRNDEVELVQKLAIALT